MQQTYFAVRGTAARRRWCMVDGLMTNGLMGDGAVQAYHNEAMTQEAVYQTAGGNAETLTGGVNMNLVPRTAATVPRRLQVRQVAEVVAGRQPHRRPERAGRHGRSTEIDELLRVERRAGRPDHQEQAVVLRRVPPRLLRQARSPTPSTPPAGVPFAGRLRGLSPDRRGSCEQGDFRREDGQPGRPPHLAGVRSATSSPSTMDRALRLRGHADGPPTPTRAPRRWCGTRRTSRPAR